MRRKRVWWITLSICAILVMGILVKPFLDTSFDYAVILNKKSPDDLHFKQSWYHGFVKRWPQVRLAKTEKLEIVCAKATSKEVLVILKLS